MESDNLLSKEKFEKNKINSFDNYKNIKADFFLEKVFNYLEKKITLKIVKYNKNLKRRINININDYKEYSEKYSSIEIEVMPEIYSNGKFININDENKIYYHIYFDNNKEEIKRKYIENNEKIELIKIIIDHPVKSFENLFADCECIKSINFKKFCRKDKTNMKRMFCGCFSLKELKLNSFNIN